MEHEEIILDRIAHALPHEAITAAIEDRMWDAGVINVQDDTALIGSRLFNVATAAMNALRVEPDARLIGRSLTIPEQTGRLGRFTARILQDCLEPRRAKKQEISLTPEYVKRVGTCGLLERYFLDSVYEPHIDSLSYAVPHRLYVTQFGKLTLLDKEVGDPSTLALAPLLIGNIKYPAGTALAIDRNLETPTITLDGLEIRLLDKRGVRAGAPLRFTAFAFDPQDRPKIFTPVEDHPSSRIDPEILENATLAHLIRALPDAKRLQKAAHQLVKMSA